MNSNTGIRQPFNSRNFQIIFRECTFSTIYSTACIPCSALALFYKIRKILYCFVFLWFPRTVKCGFKFHKTPTFWSRRKEYKEVFALRTPLVSRRFWLFTFLGIWVFEKMNVLINICLLYTSPSPRDGLLSRMPSSA